MLTSWPDIVLNSPTQFLGVGAAISPSLDNLVLKATFYLFLFLFLRVRCKVYGHQQERLLMWGFGLALLTQLYGLVILMANHVTWLTPTASAFCLSISHALNNIALITIATGYIQSHFYGERKWLNYLKAGLIVSLFIFTLSSWQWFTHLPIHAVADFNLSSINWLFHISAAIGLSFAVYSIAIKKTTKKPAIILSALSLLFVSEVLLAFGFLLAKQQAIYTVLSSLTHILALAILAYAYLRNSVEERLLHTSALTQSETKLNAMLKTINDPIWLKDPNGVFLACNAQFERFYNAKEIDLIGKTDYDFADKATADFYREKDLLAIQKGGASVNEEWIVYADNGQRALFETTKTPMFDQLGSLIGVLGVAHDITQRQRMETLAKQYELIVQSSSEAIISTTTDNIVTSWNTGAEKVFGYTADEMVGKSILQLMPESLTGEVKQMRTKIVNGERIPHFDTIRLHKSGQTIHTSTTMSPILDEKNKVIGISTIARDNTDSIISDQKLKRLSRLYQALSEINQAIVRMENEAELFPLVCRCAVDFGGLSMAWVGAVDPETQQINPAAKYGQNLEFLDELNLSTDASIPKGQGPTGQSIRENRAIFANNLTEANANEPWQKYVLSAGWHSVFTSPINRGGKPFAALCVYHTAANAFDQEIVALLNEMASDIAFALDNFDREAQCKADADSLRLAASVYTATNEAMVVSTPNRTIIDVNPAFTEVTGYSKEEIIGQSTVILSAPERDENHAASVEHVKQHGEWRGETWARRKNGDAFPIWVTINSVYHDDGTLNYRISLFTDISQKKAAEALIWKQANVDPLTGLPNRYMFTDRLDQEIKKSDRSGMPLALLFLDLDRFKEVNDSLGHSKGDQLLKITAQRLNDCTRETDTVARLGGDEFTIILSQLDGISNVYRVLESILNSIEQPFQLENDAAYVSASIGVTFYPSDADNAEALTKNADQAMYAAKSAGRNQISFFTKSLQHTAEARTRLANELHQAMAKKQIWVAYQPIVELSTGRIAKAEALARWTHPKLGEISPAEFIPVAEDTGLIVDIGDWMFKQALKQVKQWQKFDPEFQISVNKSPVQIHKVDEKIESWHQQLKKAKLAKNSIVAEITEGVLLENNTVVNDKLLEFRDAGIQVALDDFGTGYSSLSYLQKFDIDYIKIDRSFVKNLGQAQASTTLCEAIVAMAHKLDMQVIAEGIETEVQLNILKSIGCDFGQGYLFSKPVPPADFKQLLPKN